MVLLEPHVGIADGPDDACFQVLAAPDIVEHLVRIRIEQKRVDGEVAAKHVLAWIGLKCDAIRPPSVRVRVIAAEGGHLDLSEAVAHQDHAEMRADLLGCGKEFANAQRWSIRRDVVIFRFPAEQAIANAAADEIRLVACRL